jgi:hypothetical protein
VGYEIHLIRTKRIARAEWRRIVAAADPELAGYMHFRDGRISMKTPREEHLDALVRLARKLKGRVVGDDGERYEVSGPKTKAPARAPKPTPAGAILAGSLPALARPIRRQARQPFSVHVYKRRGALLVSVYVRGTALPELIIVEKPAELVRALAEATRLAHAAIARPAKKRIDETRPPYWELAGVPTWNEFVVGATAVSITVGSENYLALSYTVRDEDSPGSMTSEGEDVELTPGISDEELTRAVLALFAKREHMRKRSK